MAFRNALVVAGTVSAQIFQLVDSSGNLVAALVNGQLFFYHQHPGMNPSSLSWTKNGTGTETTSLIGPGNNNRPQASVSLTGNTTASVGSSAKMSLNGTPGVEPIATMSLTRVNNVVTSTVISTSTGPQGNASVIAQVDSDGANNNAHLDLTAPRVNLNPTVGIVLNGRSARMLVDRQLASNISTVALAAAPSNSVLGTTTTMNLVAGDEVVIEFTVTINCTSFSGGSDCFIYGQAQLGAGGWGSLGSSQGAHYNPGGPYSANQVTVSYHWIIATSGSWTFRAIGQNYNTAANNAYSEQALISVQVFSAA